MSDETETDLVDPPEGDLEDQLEEAFDAADSEESGVDESVQVEMDEPETTDTTPDEGEEIDISYKEIAPNPEADQLNLIRQIEWEVGDAENEWEDAKAYAKQKKESYEQAVKRLREAVRGMTVKLPLFDQASSNSQPSTPDSETPDDPEPWRAVDLDELGIPQTIGKHLIDAGITTLGDITDWTSADKQLIDIKGIGEAKAEKIQECLVQYWADHPQTTPESSEGEPEETTGEYSQEFQDGYAAHRDGVPSMSNPWDAETHSAARADWNAGWNKAIQDSQEEGGE